MRIHRPLLRSVRAMAPASPQARLVAKSLAELLRKRRRGVQLLGPWLLFWPFDRPSPRISLWSLVASISYGYRPRRSDLNPAIHALRSSHTYKQAERSLRCSVVSPFTRGLNYRELLDGWRDQPPERLFVFHHFDRLGYFPRCWLEQLLACQADGWQVVVSTSFLTGADRQRLRERGVLIADRANQGLCLGAYRDLSLLIQSEPRLRDHLRSLVLCNDSTLPVGQPAIFVEQLRRWLQLESDEQPTLAGLTDSAQRNAYHLQSYCLFANNALLRSIEWLRFWQNFVPAGSKDELIDKGEIGLSQHLLTSGTRLVPAYPLIRLLLSAQTIAAELERFRIEHPMYVNTTLFAWQSLLAEGFPFVKKQILFDRINLQGQTVAITSLSQWIERDHMQMLQEDLEALFMSRFSEGLVDP